ncbi:D-amino acid dehydrogenase [Nocardioides sp.]|uniref:D-amino acid dehydrogenase n=1 Tax=Nocardioides sp. TaxID=35761 RepID=UPI0035AF4EF3
MKTVVIGAGIIGVTTAYYLAREGREVVVIDKADRVGTDATGGNAGLIAPGHSFAWASPAAPKMMVQSLRGQATAIRVKPRLDPKLVSWGVQFLRECTSARAEANTLVKYQLCRYGQQELDALAEAEGIDYQQVKKGIVYLHRDQQALSGAAEKMQFMVRQGVGLDVLDIDQVVKLDPALERVSDLFVGGIHVPSDASGNSAIFTERLAQICEGLGVEFRFGTEATKLVASGNKIVSVETSAGPIRADEFVLAMGVESPRLSRTIGQRLPIYPAKGYSMTVDILDGDAVPTMGGVDEATLVAWSRQGDSMRLSSTAEFAGYSRDWKHSDFSNILATGKQMFPEGLDWDRARMRSCLRPMTPDGPPIVGKGKHQNMYYNTGHGHMGWTMGCGSSRVVTDLMLGRRPEIPLRGLEVRSHRVAS